VKSGERGRERERGPTSGATSGERGVQLTAILGMTAPTFSVNPAPRAFAPEVGPRSRSRLRSPASNPPVGWHAQQPKAVGPGVVS
jgi:hypothetical protein